MKGSMAQLQVQWPISHCTSHFAQLFTQWPCSFDGLKKRKRDTCRLGVRPPIFRYRLLSSCWYQQFCPPNRQNPGCNMLIIGRLKLHLHPWARTKLINLRTLMPCKVIFLHDNAGQFERCYCFFGWGCVAPSLCVSLKRWHLVRLFFAWQR